MDGWIPFICALAIYGCSANPLNNLDNVRNICLTKIIRV